MVLFIGIYLLALHAVRLVHFPRHTMFDSLGAKEATFSLEVQQYVLGSFQKLFLIEVEN